MDDPDGAVRSIPLWLRAERDVLKPGETIDIWVVEKALGAGGMGSVYRCHNRTASRILAAVKVLESSIRRVPGAEERFIREAEILFQLDHPSIVKVRNVRTDLDPPYLEMEFVEGRSLEDLLQEGPVPFERAVKIVAQLFDAIAYLHGKGVRHRDVKPANVLVQKDGTVKLVDFGLAMEADATRITQGTMAFGTVSYAPPEWVKPDTLDPKAWDAYAAGVVAYEVFTGDVAFPVSGGGSARQQAMQVILAKQAHAPLDPGPTFSKDIRNLIGRLTHSDVKHRLVDLDVARQLLGSAAPKPQRTSNPTIAPMPDEAASPVLPPTPPPAPVRRTGNETLQFPPLEPAPPEPEAPPALPDQPSIDPDTRSVDVVPGGGSSRALLTMMVGTLVLLAVGVLSWAAWTATRPPPEVKVFERPVAVTVSGLPPATPVGVRLRGIPSESSEGWVHRFGTGPTGPATVAVVVGAECPIDECPGSECPSWCLVHEERVTIHDGVGLQSLSVEVAPPEARETSVKAARGVALASRPEADLDAGSLMPGRYEVLGTSGKCPEDAWSCAETACEGCEAQIAELVVPWQGEVAPFEHPLKPKRVAAPGPRPTAPVASGGGGRITYGSFSRWLAKNPDWQREAAVAAGKADGSYLSDWAGTEPPAGQSSKPMVNISWYAAAAYCRRFGGLADIEAEPHSWTGSPALELRSAGGRGGWRSDSGQISTAVKLGQANSMTGARCKK